MNLKIEKIWWNRNQICNPKKVLTENQHRFEYSYIILLYAVHMSCNAIADGLKKMNLNNFYV